MILDIIGLAFVILMGIINLCDKKISKVDYGLLWAILILNLINNIGA
jgi:hypothetical protein